MNESDENGGDVSYCSWKK